MGLRILGVFACKPDNKNMINPTLDLDADKC